MNEIRPATRVERAAAQRQEGREAFASGVRQSANPYTTGMGIVWWRQGWEEAAQEAGSAPEWLIPVGDTGAQARPCPVCGAEPYAACRDGVIAIGDRIHQGRLG